MPIMLMRCKKRSFCKIWNPIKTWYMYTYLNLPKLLQSFAEDKFAREFTGCCLSRLIPPHFISFEFNTHILRWPPGPALRWHRGYKNKVSLSAGKAFAVLTELNLMVEINCIRRVRGSTEGSRRAPSKGQAKTKGHQKVREPYKGDDS